MLDKYLFFPSDDRYHCGRDVCQFTKIESRFEMKKAGTHVDIGSYRFQFSDISEISESFIKIPSARSISGWKLYWQEWRLKRA